MITSKQIINISDNYVTSKRLDKDTNLEVYVNPSLDEIKKITDNSFKTFRVRQIRFIVDNQHQHKKVYCCDAFLAIHHQLIKLSGLNIPENSPYYFAGIANVKGGGKPQMLDANEWFSMWFRKSFFSNKYPNKYSKNLQEFLSSDICWLDQYILCSPVINKLKEEFKKLANISK